MIFSLTLVAPAALVFAVLAATGALSSTTAFLGLLTIALLVAVIVRPHLEAMERLRNYMDNLAEGADEPQPRFPPAAAIGAFSAALARLGRALERLRGEKAVWREAESAVIDVLPDPFLLIDARERIVQANRAAQSLFGRTIVGRDLAAVLRDPAILAAVERAIAGGDSRDIDVTLTGQVTCEFSARVETLCPAAAEAKAAICLRDLTMIRRSERMRADFVANVSHELRTPLTSLLGFTETLRGPARDDIEAHDRFLTIMHAQASRMSRLVADLLSLSRIELEEHTPADGLVELGSAVRGVIDSLAPQAEAKEMALDFHAADGLKPVPGDADQLAQVFQNLIANAIQYGRPGTPVRIRAAPTPDGQNVDVTVADEGDGIAREHLPRLTERFYRVDAGRSRALGGTGLGLAIVKHILNRHRGKLDVDSELGRGSTFTVRLPATAA